MTSKGKHAEAYQKYEEVINKAMDDDMRDMFTEEQQLLLEQALLDAERKESADEKAWLLRVAIDSVYDQCISNYNAVTSAKPPSLHVLIKDAIKNSSDHFERGEHSRGIALCTNLLKKMINTRTYREMVSPAAKKLVSEFLESDKMVEDINDNASKVRATLDRVYNEIRLPDIYSPSRGPQVKKKKNK